MLRTQLLVAWILIAPAVSHGNTDGIKDSYTPHSNVIASVKGFLVGGCHEGCHPDEAQVERIRLVFSVTEEPPLTPGEIEGLRVLEQWAASVPDPRADLAKFSTLQNLQTKLYRFTNHRVTPTLLIVHDRPDKKGIATIYRPRVFELSIEVPLIDPTTGNAIPHEYQTLTFNQSTFGDMAKPWLTRNSFRSLRIALERTDGPFSTVADNGSISLVFSGYAALGTIWSERLGKRSLIADTEGIAQEYQELYYRVSPPEWLAHLDDVAAGTWKGFPGLVASSAMTYAIRPEPIPDLPLPDLIRSGEACESGEEDQPAADPGPSLAELLQQDQARLQAEQATAVNADTARLASEAFARQAQMQNRLNVVNANAATHDKNLLVQERTRRASMDATWLDGARTSGRTFGQNVTLFTSIVNGDLGGRLANYQNYLTNFERNNSSAYAVIVTQDQEARLATYKVALASQTSNRLTQAASEFSLYPAERLEAYRTALARQNEERLAAYSHAMSAECQVRMASFNQAVRDNDGKRLGAYTTQCAIDVQGRLSSAIATLLR